MEQRTLLDRIPLMSDTVSMVDFFCIARRREPIACSGWFECQAVAKYARIHDDNIWGCLCDFLNVNPTREDIRNSANLPLVLGGVGFRSASRISASAYWASWADCLPMVSARHRSWWGEEVGHASFFWPSNLSCSLLSPSSPSLMLESNFSFCRKSLDIRSGCGGGFSSHVQRQRLLPRVSCTPRNGRSRRTTRTWGWRFE